MKGITHVDEAMQALLMFNSLTMCCLCMLSFNMCWFMHAHHDLTDWGAAGKTHMPAAVCDSVRCMKTLM
jgi:hypothetical protein